MKKDVFVFDFDGTVADTFPYIFKVSNKLAKMYGFEEVSEKKFHELRSMSPVEIIKELQIPILKIPFILQKGRTLLKKNMPEVGIFPGMSEVIDSLKRSNKKVGILTSNSRENLDLFLKKYSIEDLDFIYTENNIFGKQFTLSKMLKEQALSKENVIYIGDEVRDIEACRVLDLDIISVTWGFSSKEALQKNEPTFLVDKPEEILGLFPD